MSSKKSVYIVLTSTSTYLSQAIKFFTNERLCHVSISFDQKLKEVYSFGRKDQRNPFIGGFVQENLNGPVFRHAQCAIYKLDVTTSSYQQMKKRINHFLTNVDRYHYNFVGMFPVMFDIEWNRRNHYFCSQFVNDILKHGDVHLFDKPSVLITPADFKKCNIPLLYEGSLTHYIQGVEEEFARHESNSINRLELSAE